MYDENLMYLRKSRSDGENETIEQILARHERQLQEYAVKLLGHTIDEKNIYREIVSGETIEDRPEINKIFERLQEGNIKRVFVIEPSRLTRGDLLDCGTVVHAFRYTNTLISTPMKEYNLEDKYDRKFFEMELTRGNDYLEYTKEILMRGRKASAFEGNYVCSIAPYGYTKVKDGKRYTLEINEKEAQYVRLIFEMYVFDGLGATAIGSKLAELGAKPRKSDYFADTTIRNILDNPVYMGKIKWQHRSEEKIYRDGKLVKRRKVNPNCPLIDGKHPPIISEELFKMAQTQRGRKSRERTHFELRNPFAGLIRCKKCGTMMSTYPDDRYGDRYFCLNRKYCGNVSSKADIIQNAITDSLKSSLRDFEVKLEQNIDDDIKSHENIIKSLEKDLKHLEVKQSELYDFLEDGIYTKDVFLQRNEKLANERERLKSALQNAKETVPTVIEYEEKIFSLHKALDALKDDSVSAKVKNNLLKEVIDVVYYEKNEATYSRDNSLDSINLEIKLR